MTIGRPNSSNNNGKVSIMNRIAMFETSNGDTTAAAQNDSNGSNNIKASAERETEDARNSRKSRHNRSDMGTSGSMERTPSTSTAATVKSLSSRSSDGRGSAANENEIKRNTGDDEGRIRARSRSSSRDGRRSAGTINAPAAPVAFGGDSSDDEPGQIMSAASASSMEPRKVVVGNYSGIRRGSKASMWEDALKNGHSAPPDINMESTNQGVVRVEEAEAKRVHEDANNVAAPSAKTFVKRGTKASMWEEKVHKQRNPADDSVSQSTKDIPVEGQKNMHARTTRSPSYSPKILAKRGSKALMWEERSKGGEASKDERVEGVSGTGGGEPPSTPPRALKDYGKGKHQSHVPQSPSSTWRQRLEERNNIGVDASSQHHDLNNEIVKEKQIFTTEFKLKESFENIDNNAFLFEDDKVAEGLREEILMDANEISENYEHEHSISRLDRTHESTMSSKWSEPTNDPSVSYLNLSETEEFLPGPSNGHSISVMESTNADDDFSSSFNGDHFVASTKPSTVSLSNSEAGGYKQNGGVRGKSPFQPIFDGQSDFVAGKGDFTSLSAKDQSIPGYSNVDGSDWIEDTPIIDAKPNTDEPSIGEIGEDAPPIPNRGRKSRSEKMKRFNSMKNNRQMINGKGASPIDAAIVVNEQSQPLPQHDAIKPIRSTPSRRSRLDKLRSPSPAMRRTSQSPSPVVSMRDNQAIGYDNELGANLDSTPVKSSKRERAISARRERSRTPTRYVGSKEVFSTPKKGEQEHVEVVTPDGTNSGRYTPSRSVSRSEKLKKTKALLNSQRTKGANSPVVAKEQRNNDIDRLDDGHIFSADRNNGFTVAEMEHRAAQREREETEHRLATQAAEMERLAEVRDIQPNNYQYESSKIESADKDVYSRGGNDLEGDVTYKDNLLPADVPPPPPTIPPPHPSPPKYTSVAYLMESSEGEQFNYSFESHHSVEKNREVDDAVQENLPSRRHEKSIDEVQVNIPLQAATLTSPSPNISQNSISPVDITMLASGKGLVKAQSPAIAWGDVNGNASQVQKRYPVKIESLPEKDLSESVERRNSPKLEISSGKKSATKSKLHDDFSIVSSTVSGNDALSTWWQSTYAATQDPEINSAVEHALAPGQAVDDDEDVFSGIDAPDDEVDGDSIGPSSHSSIDGVGGEVKESGRRPKLGILSSKTKFQDDVNRLELVREVSDEEYEDSSLHMQRKSKLSMKEKNAGKSASSKSTNLKKKKSVESGKQGKRDSSSPVTVPTAETPLDDGSDGSGSYYEDEEDYTYDESVKANRTYDLENPTIPVEWEQDHKGSGLDNQAQSKIRFSFAAIGCNVLDTVKEACVVPTEREKIFKDKKTQLLSLLNLQSTSTDHGASMSTSYANEQNDDDASQDPSFMSNTINTVGDTVALVGLTEEERRVWDDWDRKDVESPPPENLDASGFIDSHKFEAEHVEENRRKNENDERRVKAHEKLKLQVISAKVNKSEKAMEDAVDDEGESNQKDAVESTPTLTKKDSVNSTPPSSLPIGRQEVTVAEQQFLEKFTSVLKGKGLEVLKVNRNKKWESRYLSLSKEVSWISQSNSVNSSGDRLHVPRGLLWMKKFSTKPKDQSVKAIDKQGKGGILFSKLISTAITQESEKVAQLPKKYKDGKFKNSVLVTLIGVDGAGVSRTVIFHCISRGDAKLLCSGCNLIAEMLKVNDEEK